MYCGSFKRSCLIPVSKLILLRILYLIQKTLYFCHLSRDSTYVSADFLSGSMFTKSFQFGLHLLCWSPISWHNTEPRQITVITVAHTCYVIF